MGIAAIVTLVEFDGVIGGTFSTSLYLSGAGGVQPDTRVIGELTMSRSVGWPFSGERPRGAAGIGELTFANADGKLTAIITQSLRDTKVTVKRGTRSTAYASLTLVAVAYVEEVRQNSDLTITVVTRSLAGRLERAVQQNLYPSTVPNQALRARPRPIVYGTCYQVPLLQPSPFGNGGFDFHDSENFFGVDMMMDRGVPLAPGTAYTLARTTGVYGVERLTAVQGQQVADVRGEHEQLSSLISEGFANLTAWTEFNGGVGGRDVSIVAGAANFVNTLGGADLSLQYSTAQASDANEWWYYQFDCTAYVSGSLVFRHRLTLNPVECTVNRTGRYYGIMQGLSIQPVFTALNGSNCSLTIDNLNVFKVRPGQSFEWIAQQLVVQRGQFSLINDFDTVSAALIDTTHPRHYGLYVGDQLQIADALDMLCNSAPAVWYVSPEGKVTFSPIRTPAAEVTARGVAFAFDESNVAELVKITLDRAPSLSTVALGKRNWLPYRVEDLATSLQFVANSTTDKDVDIAIAGDNYRWTATGVGSVRSTFPCHGGRWYVEMTAGTVDGGQNNRLGSASVTASLALAPGGDSLSVAYGANGQSWTNGTGTAYGATWAATDVIGMALDYRGDARASQAVFGLRARFAKNGAWQSTDNPADETSSSRNALANVKAHGYIFPGANATGNSGTINFGQTATAYTVPDDYVMPAWHYALCQADYRDSAVTTVSLAAAYSQAIVAPGASSASANRDARSSATLPGWPTLLSRRADLQDFIDDVCGLYGVARSFYEFDAFIDLTDADTLQPLRAVTLTFGPQGIAAKQLLLLGVTIDSLTGRCAIRAWG